MEDIIRKIISIDQSAKEIVLNHEQEIKEKEDASRKDLEQMKARQLEQARQQGQEQYDSRVRAAEQEAGQITAKGREQVQALEQHYLSVKDQMERILFQRIFLETGEEKQGT